MIIILRFVLISREQLQMFFFIIKHVVDQGTSSTGGPHNKENPLGDRV